MIRYALPGDIPSLLDMAERFIAESEYDIEYDETNARTFFERILLHPEGDVIVFEDRGIEGGAIVFASHEFQKDPFCYVGKFFVKPESRNLGIGRDLMEAILAWAVLQECSHVFITATAGLDERQQKLFINLMKKYGLKESGPVMYGKVQ